jgi:hypothetical protein
VIFERRIILYASDSSVVNNVIITSSITYGAPLSSGLSRHSQRWLLFLGFFKLLWLVIGSCNRLVMEASIVRDYQGVCGAKKEQAR